jgi:hypothetical protein
VTTPDFIFTAEDMGGGPADINVWADWRRNVNFNTTHVLPGVAGPGTIDAFSQITFNKVGPILYNTIQTNFAWMDQFSAVPTHALWGSFDDSTNAPVVYPNGTSIAFLENQLMMQVTTTTLPPGKVNVAYTTQLLGSGGSGAPYNWSLAPDSPPPPAWLGSTVPANGQFSGTPHAIDLGTASFFVKMTDRLDSTRFTVWQVTVTVLP